MLKTIALAGIFVLASAITLPTATAVEKSAKPVIQAPTAPVGQGLSLCGWLRRC